MEVAQESRKQGAAVYDMHQLAGLLGVPYSTLWTQHKVGQIPVEGFKVGQRWLFRKSDVDRWLGIGSEPEPNGGAK